jgi:hypothetical protein
MRLVATWTAPAKLYIIIKPANSNSSAFDILQLQLFDILIIHEAQHVGFTSRFNMSFTFCSDRNRDKLRSYFVHTSFVLWYTTTATNYHISIHLRDLRTLRRSYPRVMEVVELPDVPEPCTQAPASSHSYLGGYILPVPCSEPE